MKLHASSCEVFKQSSYMLVNVRFSKMKLHVGNWRYGQYSAPFLGNTSDEVTLV